MRKKEVLMLLVAVLCSVFVSATDSLYDGWNYNKDTINAEGYSFHLSLPYEDQYSDPPDKIVLTWEGTQTIVPLQECKDWENLYICFPEHAEGDPLLNQIRRYKVHVTVERYLPKVSLERTIEPTTILTGEKVSIETILTNSGSKEARVYYADSYPDDITVYLSQIEGCGYKDHTIFFDGTIQINQKKKCTYVIEPTTSGTHTSVANVSYYDGKDNQLITDSKTITVKNFTFRFEATVPNETIQKDEQTNITVSLLNEAGDLPITVRSLKIVIPPELPVTDKGEFLREGQILTWTDTLQPNEKKNLTAYFKGKNVGKHTIPVTVDYLLRDKAKKQTVDVPLTVDMPLPIIVTHFSKDKYAIGETGTVKVRIQNPSNRFPFFNVEIDFDEKWDSFDTILAGLEPLDSLLIGEIPFTVENEETLGVEVIVTNDIGQRFTITDEIVIPVDVTKKLEKTESVEEVLGEISDDEDQEEEKAFSEVLMERITETVKEQPIITLFFAIGIVLVIVLVLVIMKLRKPRIKGVSNDDLQQAWTEIKEMQKVAEKEEKKK